MYHQETGVRISIGVALFAVAVIAVNCSVRRETEAPAPPGSGGSKVPTPAPVLPTPDAGMPDAGSPPSTDAGTSQEPGPWPTDAVLDYSQRFGAGTPQSVGIDQGLNLWFLEGDRIGVLRPGDATVRWTSGIGQAQQP